YVSDLSAIRVIDLATRAVTTLAGTEQFGNADGVGGAATFGGPLGLALDGAGNLYVADGNNGALRKISIAERAVTTLAGREAGFVRPFGLALEGRALYVGDDGDATVRRIDLDTGAVSVLLGQPGRAGVKLGALPARLNSPAGLALIGPGQL